MGKTARNIFFAAGIAAVILMAVTMHVSLSELIEDIMRAGYWIFAILGLWMILYSMNALTWRIILKGSGNVPIPFWKLLKITITGFALNYATPMGLMGGEPYKIMELKGYVGTERASSSVLLFAMMHIYAHFWSWILAILAYIVLALGGELELDTAMGTVLVMMAAFCMLGIYLFSFGYRNGIARNAVRWLAHVPLIKRWARPFAETHQKKLEKIDEQIAALHSQNSRSFYASFFLELLGRILQTLEILFALMIFNAAKFTFYDFIISYIILSFTTLLANLLFFMPLQLGGREGGFILSSSQMGMTNGIGLFISIICRIREFFWTTAGILLLKLGNSHDSQQQEASENQ